MPVNFYISPRAREAARFCIPRKRQTLPYWGHLAADDYEDPLRRWVRLREKERQFNVIPPPRHIPDPPVTRRSRALERFDNPFANIDPACLEARVAFLVSETAKNQQRDAPMRMGQTPYEAENAMFQRQLRDARRIYRIQYITKLSQVIEEEREKQIEMFNTERQATAAKIQAARDRRGERLKRFAILKEKQRVEDATSEALRLSKRSSQKKHLLTALGDIEEGAQLLRRSNEREGGMFRRNILAYEIMKDLDKTDDEPKHHAYRPPAERVYNKLVKMSFEKLPEDAPDRLENEVLISAHEQRRRDKERARVMFRELNGENQLTPWRLYTIACQCRRK
eukprot:GHVN01107287.1.p1 GENE.GHVN01107287.1~~GHVN01107287.1.p1  ORF type:complete len:338 (+),score=37.52 GHVN01107287.1:20-1033(+)